MVPKKEYKTMRSYLLILTIHVIKTHVERRITNSWQRSINNSLKYINKLNESYFNFEHEIKELWDEAVDFASDEINGGCSIEYINNSIDKELVILNCLILLGIK